MIEQPLLQHPQETTSPAWSFNRSKKCCSGLNPTLLLAAYLTPQDATASVESRRLLFAASLSSHLVLSTDSPLQQHARVALLKISRLAILAVEHKLLEHHQVIAAFCSTNSLPYQAGDRPSITSRAQITARAIRCLAHSFWSYSTLGRVTPVCLLFIWPPAQKNSSTELGTYRVMSSFFLKLTSSCYSGSSNTSRPSYGFMENAA